MRDAVRTGLSTAAEQVAVERYLSAERRRPRLRLVVVALVLFGAGSSLLPLAALMTDIGHAVGLAATAALICVGAGVVLFKGLTGGRAAATRYRRTSA